MFDIGWTELLLIGVVALIVVGPKDLPGMFRTLGRFTAKMRSMAREFQRTMEQAADETGVKGVAKDLQSATSARSLGLDKIQSSANRFKGGWKAGLDALEAEGRESAEPPAAQTGSGSKASDGEEATGQPAQSDAKAAPNSVPAETGVSTPEEPSGDEAAVEDRKRDAPVPAGAAEVAE